MFTKPHPLKISCTMNDSSSKRSSPTTRLPLLMETRNLFKYFMLSKSEVEEIEDLFVTLEDQEGELGIPISNLLVRLHLNRKSFYEKFFLFISENNYVNFSTFVKLILMCTFSPSIKILMNCNEYFNQESINKKSDSVKMFLNLFSMEEIPKAIFEDIYTDLKMTNGDVVSLLVDHHLSKKYNELLLPFFNLHNAIKKYLLSKETIDSVYYKITHYEDLYYYYIHNNNYPPLSPCQRIFNLFKDTSNQYTFQYYMTPEVRMNYKFPFLFTHGGVALWKSGSRISMKINRTSSTKVLI